MPTTPKGRTPKNGTAKSTVVMVTSADAQLSHEQNASGLLGHQNPTNIGVFTSDAGKRRAIEGLGANTYVVDAELEQEMIRKREELAKYGAEDLDSLLKNGAPASVVKHSQYSRSDSVAYAQNEMDMTFSRAMTPWATFTRACATVFITLELETSSTVAKYLDLLTKAVITIAIAVYLLSTSPAFQYQPSTCDNPSCSDDQLLCPGYQVCESIELPSVTLVSNLSTYYFTVEYGLKLLTVWAVSPHVAGVVPPEWEAEHEKTPGLSQPRYSPWYQTYKFFWRMKNLVDFASIFPCYLQYFVPSGGGSTNFVRTLRLLRLIRILRLLRLLTFLKNVDVAMEIIWVTLNNSTLMLSVVLFFSMVFMVLMGCLIYLAEQGTFTVTQQYPNGAYLKPNDDETGQKVSNIFSAVQGLYWAIGTSTGNGNIPPTTHMGKFLQALVSIFGVLGLAFPVGILGSEQARAYTKLFKKLKDASDARDRERERLAAVAKAAAAATDRRAGGGRTATIRLVRGLVGLGSGDGGTAVTTHDAVGLREARHFMRATKFKKAAMRFVRGEFPPFPPGTLLAVTQAVILADLRAAQLERQRDRVGALQRKYDRALAAHPVRADKLPGPVAVVYGAGGTMAARPPRKSSWVSVLGRSQKKDAKK